MAQLAYLTAGGSSRGMWDRPATLEPVTRTELVPAAQSRVVPVSAGWTGARSLAPIDTAAAVDRLPGSAELDPFPRAVGGVLGCPIGATAPVPVLRQIANGLDDFDRTGAEFTEASLLLPQHYRASAPEREGPVRSGRHLAAIVLIAAVVLGALTSCTSTGSNGGRSSPSAPTSPVDRHSSPLTSPTSSGLSPSPSVSSSYADPKVAAAVAAYLAYARASQYAEQHPPKLGQVLPKDGDFTRYAFDPARGNMLNEVTHLGEAGLAFRGTPPTPRISVVGIAPDAAPYPMITLSDCPTAPPNWRVVAVTAGPPPTVKSSAPAKPPYQSTAQVIFYEKRWGVYQVTLNQSRTCSPT